MFSATNFFKSVALAVAVAGSIGSASATVVSGNFNAAGYAVVGLNVASTANVDLAYLSGYNDPTFSLYDGAGLHLISNDDATGLLSHLTRTLSAGHYSLLVSYCCNFSGAIPGATFATSDGVNSGSYWLGGSGTLAGMSGYLDTNTFFNAANAPYSIRITNADVIAVPEPAGVALFGMAAAGMLLARRRTQQRV